MSDISQEIESATRKESTSLTRTVRKADREFSWRPIFIYYCFYIAIVFIGDAFHYHTNTVGGCVFLLLISWRYWQYLLRMKIDALFYCALFSVLISIIPVAFYDYSTFAATYNELIKYYALIFIIVIGNALPLSPITRNRDSFADALQIILLAYLIIGWVWPGGSGVVLGRVKGFLPNPNGFALTAMMLLFVIKGDVGKLRLYATHAIVICLIYVSHTSGAILGYTAGFFYRLIYWDTARNVVAKIIGSLVIVSIILGIFLFIPSKTFVPMDNLMKKIAVIKEHWNSIEENKSVSYYDIVSQEGEDVTSGLWRIKQWQRIMNVFFHSDLDKVIFGHGVGITDVMFQHKSHNDYLRILFETGIIGFVFNLSLWLILFQRMDKSCRWVPIMVAIYCITENNYDDFFAMSLLVLYMISCRKEHFVKVEYDLNYSCDRGSIVL
jgi:hypothetical protein